MVEWRVTPPPPEEIIMTVDVINAPDIPTTDILDEPDQAEEQDAPKPPKLVYNTSDTAPDLITPQEPDLPEIAEVIPPPPPKEDIVTEETVEAVVEEKPEVKSPPPKPRSKPKPPKRSKPKTDDLKPAPNPKEQAKDDEKSIDSLLKSVLNEDSQESSPKPQEQDTGQGQTSQIANFDRQLTGSEISALNEGVRHCWYPDIGVKNAKNLVVKLRVFLNPDMRVRDVQILDQFRYKREPAFRAAADAARRALLNESCRKLRLPQEKYDYYKVFQYIFDPSKML